MNNSQYGYGPLMLDLQGLQIQDSEKELLQSPAVGGIILFSRNFQDTQQLQELVSAIRSSNEQLLIAVDQEGGRVQRFREGFTRLPPLYHIGQLYRQDEERGLQLAHQAAWLMAAELLQFGIDISFAPVLDLYDANSRVIADRAFAAEPDAAIHLARAYIEGLHEAGMCATGKHFPGHGSVEADSHVELPTDSRSPEEILNRDYRVFAECIELLDGIMPAHVIYSELDANCAGFSKFWLQDKLRQQLAFDGLVFSDDLTMAAAEQAGGLEERIEIALDAGCDMVLVCNAPELALQANEWLLKHKVQGSRRIASLRAIPAPEISNLKKSDKWHAAREALVEMYAGQEETEWNS